MWSRISTDAPEDFYKSWNSGHPCSYLCEKKYWNLLSWNMSRNWEDCITGVPGSKLILLCQGHPVEMWPSISGFTPSSLFLVQTIMVVPPPSSENYSFPSTVIQQIFLCIHFAFIAPPLLYLLILLQPFAFRFSLHILPPPRYSPAGVGGKEKQCIL